MKNWKYVRNWLEDIRVGNTYLDFFINKIRKNSLNFHPSLLTVSIPSIFIAMETFLKALDYRMTGNNSIISLFAEVIKLFTKRFKRNLKLLSYFVVNIL